MEKKIVEPTDAEKEAYFNKLLNKLKQDPLYEVRAELGKLLMIHIEDLTPEQRKRYDELITLNTPKK